MKCPVCGREFHSRPGFLSLTEYNGDWCHKCIRKDRRYALFERACRLNALPFYLTDMPDHERGAARRLAEKIRHYPKERLQKELDKSRPFYLHL